MKEKGKIFLVDDDELTVSSITWALTNEGYKVHGETDPTDIVPKIRDYNPDLILLDISFPGVSGIDMLNEILAKGIYTPVVMLTSDTSADTAVRAMKIGAVDYITKPFNLDAIKIIIDKIVENKRLRQEVDYYRKVNEEFFKREIIGKSAVIKDLKDNMEKLASAGVDTILVTGESGTGKELVARHIHRSMHSKDSDTYAPFIGINCSAFPETLLESELFGHVKGAFTDAKSHKKGLFELASGGTLLLDEVGEMKPDLQTKLLRVLEERRIRPIGGKEEVPVDVTVISTTNRDIAGAVEKGAFRMDLLYRLNTFSLHILPLRERKEDIPVLARYFLWHFGKKYNNKALRDISDESEEMMCSYTWFGNVRELKNVIERIVVLESCECIMPHHLPHEIRNRKSLSDSNLENRILLPENGLSLAELEKDLMSQALKRTNQNRARAAKLLDISYESIRYHIKKYGLE